MRPLTKILAMGRTPKYYPSQKFSPSVALGALLTRNLGAELIDCSTALNSLSSLTNLTKPN